jgi:hypothetical protein
VWDVVCYIKGRTSIEVLKNMVHRRILGSKREEVTGEQEIRNICTMTRFIIRTLPNIIIIIIIGKTALFEPWPSLEDSAIFHLVFSSLDLATIFFYRVRLSALHPIPNLEYQVSAFMSLSDSVAQLYPQAPGSIFVTFYDSQRYGGGIPTRLHRGKTKYVYYHSLIKEDETCETCSMHGTDDKCTGNDFI